MQILSMKKDLDDQIRLKKERGEIDQLEELELDSKTLTEIIFTNQLSVDLIDKIDMYDPLKLFVWREANQDFFIFSNINFVIKLK